ncbi:MAG: tetratricopeptide repeat protein [Planctomycetes bacterium]|nr:tetratricopeptide repeat protein [Planctomycetota bacterium]
MLRNRATARERVQYVLELFNRGAYRDAYDALREIMENDPELSEPEMAVAYMIQADLELFANGDVREAQKSLDRARDFDHPETGYYYRIQGDIKLRAGNPQAAIEYYEKSVMLEPAVGNLTMLAQALSAVEDNRAEDVWARILKEDPQNCLAHLGVALEAARSGDRDRAMMMTKKAEQLDPSAEELLQVGRVYRMIGEPAAAVVAYSRAERLGYKTAKLYASIAACYSELGQTDQARQFAESALRCDPEDEYAKTIWRALIGGNGVTS